MSPGTATRSERTDEFNRIGIAWERGEYAVATYWSRVILSRSRTPEPAQVECAQNILQRLDSSRRRVHRVKAAVFDWDRCEAAGRELDLIRQETPSRPEIPWLEEEIRLHLLLRQGLEQVRSGDPHQPQDFDSLIAEYPADRPGFTELQSAANNLRALLEWENQVRNATTANQLAEIIRDSRRFCETSPWNIRTDSIYHLWDDRLAEFLEASEKRIESALCQADFSTAETTLDELEDHSKVWEETCPSYEWISEMRLTVQQRLEEYERLIARIESEMRANRPYDALKLLSRLAELFPEDPEIELRRETAAQLIAEQDKIRDRMEHFIQQNRWREADIQFHKVANKMPEKWRGEVEQWIAEQRRKSNRNKLLIGLALFTAVSLLMAGWFWLQGKFSF